MSSYYWLNTEYGNARAFALIRTNEDNENEVVCKSEYADIGIDLEAQNDDRQLEEDWQKIDRFIESKIGFVPEYEIN